MRFKRLLVKILKFSLPVKIFFGIIAGVILAMLFPKCEIIGILGQIFVGALKAVAPILVFILVLCSIVRAKKKRDGRFKTVILLYLFSTFIAAFIAVVAAFMFPINLSLDVEAASVSSAPNGIYQVISNVLLNIIANPVDAIMNGNYLGILFWAALFGFALKKSSGDATKSILFDFSKSIYYVVKKIINFAPFGIMGLVYATVSANGIEIFSVYGKLILLLAAVMLFVYFVAIPFIVFCVLKINPYPLIFICAKESGVTAFFTRSSAANIPINMELCEKLSLDDDVYNVSIPLGATINMSGAAITITIMTLCAVQSLSIPVDIVTAFVLSVLATFAACGASGVAGGSLLLIPMACSLFGISPDIAMQVVGVGFVIGVVQDSLETALNSSSDVIFTATSIYLDNKNKGSDIKIAIKNLNDDGVNFS